MLSGKEKMTLLNQLEGWAEFMRKFQEPSKIIAKNKAKLLEMARNGEPKPLKHKHPLGTILQEYTCKTRKCYDAEFDIEIRKAAPHWFVDTATLNKAKLLEMARNGKPRPKKNCKLGRRLISYTSKKGNCYDVEFDAAIRKSAPHWFVDTATLNKAKLLEMARNGKPRPSQTQPLGKSLSRYTSKKSTCYDRVFTSDIYNIVPGWFVSTSAVNKAKLLEMAQNGEPKPSREYPLGRVLTCYTKKSNGCYDVEFDTAIRKAAPHWFVNTAVANKAKLLEMARNGEPRPSHEHPLGNVLCHYTRPDCHDKKFNVEIRQIKPEWFINTATLNKVKLLEMARNGEPRPSRKCPLGLALSYYTSKSSKSYDVEFDSEIRQAASGWWASTAALNKAKLLEMARNGEPKPTVKKHPLGKVLAHYTCKSSAAYDAEFDTTIRKLAWFGE